MVKKQEVMVKVKPVSKLLLKMHEVYETVFGTRGLSFLPSGSSAVYIIVRNSLPRPSLAKGGPVMHPTQEKNLGAFGEKGTQFAEVAKWGFSRERVGDFDLDHGHMYLSGELEMNQNHHHHHHVSHV